MERTKVLPFLTPAQDVQPWARVVDCTKENCATDLSNYPQEIGAKQHRLYVIACTPRHNRQHFHVRIAGVLVYFARYLPN